MYVATCTTVTSNADVASILDQLLFVRGIVYRAQGDHQQPVGRLRRHGLLGIRGHPRRGEIPGGAGITGTSRTVVETNIREGSRSVIKHEASKLGTVFLL